MERPANLLDAVIDTKLSEVSTGLTTAPEWHAAWKRLGRHSPKQERLAVYQAVRDAASLPNNACFFLVAYQVLKIANEELSDAGGLRQGARRLIDGEPSSRPFRGEATDGSLSEAMVTAYADTLDRFGESEIADMLRSNREEFDRRIEAGRRFFEFDAADLCWLVRLLDMVEDCIEADPAAPLRLGYKQGNGFWEVLVYVAPAEYIGGASDGAVVAPAFMLDLEQLRRSLEEITVLELNAPVVDGADGPAVYIEGVFEGRDVHAQILVRAPRGASPGLKVDVTRGPQRLA